MQALRIAALVACLAVMAAPLARADDTAALPALADAQAVLGATVADVQANGVAGIRAHAGGLERALAGAKDAILATRPAQGRITVLTDGPTDTLAALAAAVADKRDAVAVRDPYPAISLYLGSYYNEIGKPRDALRVLDAGLSLYHMKDYISLLGETRPGLLVERTAALTALRRFDDAIAAADAALAEAPPLPDSFRAHLDRNKGFALTELGRLDEAEAAYRDSLKLEPENPTALQELDYLAKLKAGGAKEQGGLKPLQKPDASKQPPV